MNTIKHCIARRLKEARLAFGISQRKLGILARIDEHSASARMNQYETGTHVPNLLTLQHIATALGYPVAFFASDDDLVAEIIYLTQKLSETDKQTILNTARTLATLAQEVLNCPSRKLNVSLTE